MFYDRHGEISFHTVAAKLRPSWTGVQENRPFIGRILKTLEIFQLFQYWPEAILGEFNFVDMKCSLRFLMYNRVQTARSNEIMI